jgi:hypothetical protein
MCGHANCGALFTELEDSNSHARQHHAGVALANTCALREVEDVSGKVELVLVVEGSEQGQWFPTQRDK